MRTNQDRARELAQAIDQYKLARKIAGLFAQPRRLAVDLAGVTRVDSAAMALLLEMHRLASAADSSLSLQHVPAALRNLIHICELDPILPAAD